MELRPIFSALLRNKTAPLLVALQVAISLAILANALFIVQTRLASAQRPSGIDDEAAVVYFQVRPLDKRTHNEAIEQQRRELAALKALPGVRSVAWTTQMPMSTSGSSGSVRTSLAQTRATADPAIYSAPSDLVATLGLKLTEGRDFKEDEAVEMDPENDSWIDKFPKVAIVTRSLAELMFPGETSFLGKRFYQGLGVGSELRIVGVVEHLQTTQAQPGAAGDYSIVIPWRLSNPSSRYALRVDPGQGDRVLAAGEEALRKVNARPVRVSQRTVTEDRYNRYRNERAMAWMLVAVSVLLLLVTVSGIVGMTALRVAQRRKQIGVRRALGARWRDIVRYFVTENLFITSGGIAAGLVLAIGLNQLLMRNLEMGRLPLGYLAFGAAALWLLGIAAVWGPASRAANTPPAIATRTA
ncbi:ABC transporter permease [Caenimonas aquaedulcis]|uniref:ABC transporter permease n=1 Tax=Caenimonas aquaedulcis TaxID=2793270 RepID=A0A931H4Y7_9BURK|nr:FtsX-like permease family protein [Caenimonas aquaedulcis]MBG9388633.1 ABC transporter permease [Caenimonas aquaedulcis]